jgi:hypothetical protein
MGQGVIKPPEPLGKEYKYVKLVKVKKSRLEPKVILQNEATEKILKINTNDYYTNGIVTQRAKLNLKESRNGH